MLQRDLIEVVIASLRDHCVTIFANRACDYAEWETAHHCDEPFVELLPECLVAQRLERTLASLNLSCVKHEVVAAKQLALECADRFAHCGDVVVVKDYSPNDEDRIIRVDPFQVVVPRLVQTHRLHGCAPLSKISTPWA